MKVFDGHNDVLSKLRKSGGVRAAHSFQSETGNHVDQAKAERGGLAGGFFALWVESTGGGDYEEQMQQEHYDVPLPPKVSQEKALQVVLEQTAILLQLQQLGAVQLCTSIDTLKQAIDGEPIAAVLHMEGCEAIDPDFNALDVLHAAGLRSLGPVWSRSNAFGHGVPFRYPATPDIGTGLTDAGLELVRRCNSRGIMIDLSHLNLAGFLDVAQHSVHPLVATHSNAHSLCPHARNLTDEQLEIIRASGGMVGLNFASAFLRRDGRMLSDVPIEQMLRHLDYLIDALGESGVGLGSDFDGALVPAVIGDSAGLPVLVQAMREHGYGEELVTRVCHGNWVDVLARTWQV